MMPSPKADPGLEPLPPALSSMWRLCKLGYRHEPRLMVVSFVLSQLAALPDALLALWLWLLGKGVLRAPDRLDARSRPSAWACPTAATWFLRTVSTRVQRRFRDKVTIALESHVARLQATVATVAHHERPEYLDRLSMLRNQVFVLDHMYMSLFSTLGWILRLGVTMALLASIHPALLLLAVFAIPTVLTSAWRPEVERAAQERGAQTSRLARHLFTIATTAPPGKEVRVTGIGERLITDRRAAWERWYGPVAAARWGSALWHALGWAVFGLAYVGAVVFVSSYLRAPASAVLLVLAAGARLSGYIGATVGEIGFLRGFWMDGSRRLAWLEDYAASVAAAGRSAGARGIATRSAAGARFLRLPGHVARGAGRCVAVLAGGRGGGDRGRERRRQDDPGQAAGQDVRALVGCDPGRRCAAGSPAMPESGGRAWRARSRISSASNSAPGTRSGWAMFRAWTTIRRWPPPWTAPAQPTWWSGWRSGLDTQLGPTWPDGVELSFGQWQKLALARGFMRDQPLLLILDEPTAALDAETEHALFERYAAAARGGDRSGRITILVSHRFSTVRMADLIVVLDGARLVEVGTHEELMAKGGQYAELYGIQAAAYR